jgi:hypothetical protein
VVLEEKEIAFERAEVDVGVGRQGCQVDEFDDEIACLPVTDDAAAHTQGGVVVVLTAQVTIVVAQDLHTEVGGYVLATAVLST